MDIQSIKTTVIDGGTQAYKIIKHFAVWGGRQIQIGVTDYLIPAINALWSLARTYLAAFANQVKTGPGLAFALATGLFVAGIAAFKIADRKAYEEDVVAKTAWKTLGVIAFISSTVATSFAIAAIVTL